MALTDLNGDGRVDLAGISGATVDLWLNHDGGSVSDTPEVYGGSGPLRAGEIDGDRRPDFVTIEDGLLAYLNDGDGGFSVGPLLSYARSNPIDFALGDFNGDGRSDFAVADFNGPLDVLLSVPDGGYATSVPPGANSAYPKRVAIADFDGDGKLDIVATGFDGAGLWVYLGQGDGGFAAGQAVGVDSFGYTVSSLAVADVDGDGKPDLLASTYQIVTNGSGLRVLVNRSTPGALDFAPAEVYAIPEASRSLATGDFDGDRRTDVAFSDLGNNHLIGVFMRCP